MVSLNPRAVAVKYKYAQMVHFQVKVLIANVNALQQHVLMQELQML